MFFTNMKMGTRNILDGYTYKSMNMRFSITINLLVQYMILSSFNDMVDSSGYK